MVCISLHCVLQLLCDHAVARLLEHSVNTQKIILSSWCCLLSTLWQLKDSSSLSKAECNTVLPFPALGGIIPAKV